MDLHDMVLKTRSYRRFDASVSIKKETLLELIELARRTGSGANRQPLKYVLSSEPQWNKKIFESLAWAGYLADWSGPIADERPTGYIIILNDKSISDSSPIDVGIAAQTILLGATTKNLGGCMFGSIGRKKLSETLALPDHLDIVLIIALGKPVEKVVLEDAEPGASIKYYREPDGTHHVPKRRKEELVFRIYPD